MNIPELGVGMVFVPGLDDLFQPGECLIDVVEIEPETFWQWNRAEQNYSFPRYAIDVLEQISLPKIVHSIGFGLGGTNIPGRAFAEALQNSIDILDARWASEHLSVTHIHHSCASYHTGFNVPALQTEAGATSAANTIQAIASKLSVGLAVETAVNYLKPRPGELRDGEFVRRVTQEAGCGILLDIHNIWTNELNGRQKTEDFLKAIPLERVWEIHLGGGFSYQNFWLDAHSGAVPVRVLEITKEIISHLPNLGAVIFEIFPSFLPVFGVKEIATELEQIKKIWELRKKEVQREQRSSCLTICPAGQDSGGDVQVSPAEWEMSLGEAITGGNLENPLFQELLSDPGVGLIRDLIWQFRASSLSKTFIVTFELFIISQKTGQLKDILDHYFCSTKPTPFASQEAENFMEYMQSVKNEMPFLQETLLYDSEVMNALLTQKKRYVHFECNPVPLLESIAMGKLPDMDSMEYGNYELEIVPENLHMKSVISNS